MSKPFFSAAIIFHLFTLQLAEAEFPDFDVAQAAANRGDFKAAIVDWLPLADDGNMLAAFNVARIFARGDGVPRNFERARHYFSVAASGGHARSMYFSHQCGIPPPTASAPPQSLGTACCGRFRPHGSL